MTASISPGRGGRRRDRNPFLPLGLAMAVAAAVATTASPRAQTLDLTQGGPVEITATDGLEWRQAEQVVVARGDARAVRGGVTVTADRLLARYRPRNSGGAPAPAPAGRAAPGPAETPASGSEIWRFEAEGNVHITTATERAQGDRAVYDIDQAVMVLSGRAISLTTPDQRITARDSLEYWPQRRMAVARGGAVVTTVDNRRIAADTLVAYFLDAEGGAAPPRANASAAPAGQQRTSPLPGSDGDSRIERVEAYGSVEIRTETDVVRGERGVYSPATGMARLVGGVRITRGENQLHGQEAIVNLRTGVARLVSVPGGRVQGLLIPQENEGPENAVPGTQQQQQPSPGGSRGTTR